jgi:hypothetical protein
MGAAHLSNSVRESALTNYLHQQRHVLVFNAAQFACRENLSAVWHL